MSIKTPRTKAGTSRLEATARRRIFVKAYLTNGRNALQAAISAGFSERGAGQTGYALLKEPQVMEMIAAQSKEYAAITGLTAERTLLEVARIAYADPRRQKNEDGSFKTLHELDDDNAAVVAGEKYDGETGILVERKYHDKNSALDKAMKHLGLYEKDNKQREPVAVTVKVVG